MNALARRLTGFCYAEHGLMKFRWAEISTGWGLALALCKFEENWSLHCHLIYVNMFFTLWRPRREPEGGMESYGFSIPFDPGYGLFSAVHLNWGDASKIIHMPWQWVWCRTSILAEDGKHWIHELVTHRGNEVVGQPPKSDKWFHFRDLPKWTYEAPYRYVLNSGEVQDRRATISVMEMEWRWRWFSWLPWPRMVRRSIEIEFDGEVGERAGSWKGGCVGCGYDLRYDETPWDCLRRMERERKF